MRVVFFDLETSGLNPETDDIIQIAAIATDHKFQELESFEVKVKFQIKTAENLTALNMNSYDARTWEREAHPPQIALNKFIRFARKYQCVLKHSKGNNTPYKVVLLGGYNTEGFDRNFLWTWGKRISPNQFLPFAFHTFDVYQIVKQQKIMNAFSSGQPLIEFGSLKLENIAKHESSHDALGDVRATVELARKVCYGAFDPVGV